MSDVGTTAGGGIGFFGALIILGLMGMGPCADSCEGCGPTMVDVQKQKIDCELMIGDDIMFGDEDE